MIEPVHCGSDSILKVRFLGHPVVAFKKNVKTWESSGNCFFFIKVAAIGLRIALNLAAIKLRSITFRIV